MTLDRQSPAGYPAAAMLASGGPPAPRRRRRFVTEPTDPRPLRVCRFPRPVDDLGTCKCGGALDATRQSRTGWRHRPVRRGLAR